MKFYRALNLKTGEYAPVPGAKNSFVTTEHVWRFWCSKELDEGTVRLVEFNTDEYIEILWSEERENEWHVEMELASTRVRSFEWENLSFIRASIDITNNGNIDIWLYIAYAESQTYDTLALETLGGRRMKDIIEAAYKNMIKKEIV